MPHVAQVRERDEIAARGGAGQARQLRHLGDGQARALLIKRFDDLQALFQTGDQITFERAVCALFRFFDVFLLHVSLPCG